MPSDLCEEKTTDCGVTEGRVTQKGKSVYTWQDLSKLNERHNAHIAVRGKVYDVSSFVNMHPGGVEQLLLGAGREITPLFECYHSSSAYKVLEKFYVGDLITNEHPVFPEPGKFRRTVNERVAKYFKENNIDPKNDYWMFLRYVVFVFLYCSGWFGLMYFQDNWLMAILSSLIFGFFGILVVFTCTHDASHYAVTHKPWVWQVVSSAHDFLQGASSLTWTHQHIVGHHLYTNIDGHDPDIMTSITDGPDFRRIKINQKWLPYYLYQHLYCPLLYCLLGVKSRLQDFFLLYNMRNGMIRMNKPTTLQYFKFFGGKIFNVYFRFLFPLYFMPIWKLVVLSIIAELIGSLYMAMVFQVSHMNSEVEWPHPDENNVMHTDWAELQVASTQDYATDSWFWSVFTGSLNHQVAHHLFPGTLQSHYFKITPIIVQTCKEFGIKYNYVDTPLQVLARHFQHLKRLGQHLVNQNDKKE